MFKLTLALVFSMTLFAGAAFACPACMNRPDPQPVEKPEVKIYEWHMQLDFEARIRWSEENWQEKAAEIIKKVEALDGVASAKAGMPGQIILQLTEDAFEIKTRTIIRCGNNMEAKQTVRIAEIKNHEAFMDAVKPIFEDDALPLKGLDFSIKSDLPAAPAGE